MRLITCYFYTNIGQLTSSLMYQALTLGKIFFKVQALHVILPPARLRLALFTVDAIFSPGEAPSELG